MTGRCCSPCYWLLTFLFCLLPCPHHLQADYSSTVIGCSSSAVGERSLAIGESADATHDNSMVLSFDDSGSCDSEADGSVSICTNTFYINGVAFSSPGRRRALSGTQGASCCGFCVALSVFYPAKAPSFLNGLWRGLGSVDASQKKLRVHWRTLRMPRLTCGQALSWLRWISSMRVRTMMRS